MSLILSVLSLAALTTACLLASAMRAAANARSWPQHRAVIKHSTITRKVARIGYQFYVALKFEYSTDRPRVGSCMLPSQWGTSREGYARRLASHFREGAHVTAYVDPRRPERVVLLPGVDGREWAVLCLMVITAVGAAAAAFVV